MEESQEARIKDITRTDFQQWKHHPVSKLFFQFMRDKKDFVQEVAIGQWLSGNPLSDSDTIRGQIVELEDLSNIEFESIRLFYEHGIEAT